MNIGKLAILAGLGLALLIVMALSPFVSFVLGLVVITGFLLLWKE